MEKRNHVVSLDRLKDFISDENYIIIVDSCVFLDYYRYSSQTAKSILENLEYLNEYIWIPNQVYKEFKRNYELVLKPNFNKYNKIFDKIISFKKDFENNLEKSLNEYNKFKFPKINELNNKILEHLDEIKEETEEYKKDITKEIKDNRELLKNNSMLTFIENLKSNNQVGRALTPSKLLEIVEEGESRYRFNLPPGYEDSGKNENQKNDDLTAPYGDLIIWKAIIEKAQQKDIKIIFTTSDSKQDWWYLDDTKEIIGPREELLEEFLEEVNAEASLLMMPMKEFVRNFSIVNGISSLHLEIELNAEEILQENLFESQELIESCLTDGAYHIHLGNLEDIEDFELINVEVNHVDVEFDEETARITGEFQIEASGNFVEYISREHSQSSYVTIKLTGDYSLEIELDFEKDQYAIADFEILELNLAHVKIHYDEADDPYYEICNVCEENVADYNLYLNKRICRNCSEDSTNYFLCTNCNTFYERMESISSDDRCVNCLLT